MTNFEYFKDEIIERVSMNKKCMESFAVVNGKPVDCKETHCRVCECNEGPHVRCADNRKAWLNAEHIEKPKLTKKERQFCELIETGWICRDNDLELYYAKEKPHKGTYCEGEWITPGLGNYTNLRHICNGMFSFITWDDKEPWSVEELLKLEYED